MNISRSPDITWSSQCVTILCNVLIHDSWCMTRYDSLSLLDLKPSATCTSPKMRIVYRPKFCISIVFNNFSWDGCNTQENFGGVEGGGRGGGHGVLWEMCKWRILVFDNTGMGKINRVKDLHCFIFKRLPLIAFPFLVARETSCKLFVPWF